MSAASERRYAGARARRSGSNFETELERSFGAYLDAGIAVIAKMPVPMRPTGLRHPKFKVPLWMPAGKAPFDIYGHTMDTARFIGAEAKSDAKREPSLSIMSPDKSGHGIQAHQLFALDALAKAGGIARVIWSNGGEVGVIGGEKIMTAAAKYEEALKISKAPLGSKSIRWKEFTVLAYSQVGNRITLDWLGMKAKATS